MPTKKTPVVLFVVILTVFQLACNLSGNSAATPDTFATLNGLYTASALTEEAGGAQTGLTATPGLPLPTTTAGAPPTATNLPIVSTPVPVSRCDAMQFLGDVSYPDGSPISRNSSFVKTWRIQNIGTCSWTPSYALVFFTGDSMSGPSAVSLPRNVNPGETVELSVTLTAPNKEGHYTGYWKLRNASGVLFGFGTQADTAFWVDIKVPGSAYVAYSFVDSYCEANWGNDDDKVLPCPGADGDPNGFVIRLKNPVMENGVVENEPGLLTVPPDVRNGVIGGMYPSFTVQSGDRFRAIVNCEYNAPKCNVVFQLDYKNNGKVKTLATWNEAYEGEYFPVDVDLSSLAGETVKFILMVSANGGQNGDNAIWLNPHILRQGVQPATAIPTLTFTPTITFTPTFTLTPTLTPTATPTNTP